jgi:hypothetical protein
MERHMLMRAVTGCAALAATLAFAAAPARACQGLACLFAQHKQPDVETKPAAQTKPTSTPLKLNAVARGTAQSAPSTAAKRTSQNHVSIKNRKRAVKRTLSKGPNREAAGPSTPPVRVVASDELNEIDLRADAPVIEHGAVAFAEAPVRPTRVSVVNIDRRTGTVPAASVVAPAPEPESPLEPSAPPDNFVLHVWAMLQSKFSNMVSAVRRFGE